MTTTNVAILGVKMSFLLAESSPSSLSAFWIMLFAAAGGVFVFVGLSLEKLAELKNKKGVPQFIERHKSLGWWGWGILMSGIALEIGLAIWSAKDAWETRQIAIKNDPLNQPIVSASATARVLIKGDKYVRPPISDPNWRASILFIAGTNLTGSNGFISLSATLPDVEMINILGVERTDRAYDISFHQSRLLSSTNMDAAIGKPAHSFSNVQSLILSMPQIDFEGEDEAAYTTNTDEVISGLVTVTINSSLTWTFDIPPQKHRWGMITSRRITTENGKPNVEVMPVTVRDFIEPPRFTNRVFNGK